MKDCMDIDANTDCTFDTKCSIVPEFKPKSEIWLEKTGQIRLIMATPKPNLFRRFWYWALLGWYCKDYKK